MKDIICKAVNFKDYQNSKSQTLIDMIFQDLLTLLRFVHKAQKGGLLNEPFFFTNQINYLDSIWHHFILHTKLYHDFCSSEFGEYLHHHPEALNVESNENNISMEEVLKQQMTLLENHLGPEFVNRIFFIYPELLK
ncbi:hypothetical protein [Bdellovibrio sp. BCCA]|uniref:hypothetical protein n=1 Tax=Bdellovibrio sp. BCCA TaxID=3136281 RepID=UPI0030F21DE0